MNKKIVIAVCAVLAVAIAAGAAFYVSGNKNKETTTASTSTTAPLAGTITNQTTAAQSTTTTAQSSATTVDANAFLYNGYWYIFDDDKVCAYALKFEKGTTVKISYFNDENVNGFDAQYYKNGNAKYEINNNKIKITGIPEECEVDSIELEIRDAKNINYLGVDGVNKKDLKLDYAFKYFNS